VCTYDRVYPVAGKRERVRPGAFHGPLERPGGVLRFRHIGERPGDQDDPEYIYGPVRMLRESDGALYAEAEVLDGARGDQLLALVTSKTIRGVSMSATVSESKPARDPAGALTDVTRVRTFHGFSLTPTPGYDDAEVLSLREEPKQRDLAALAARRAENQAIAAQLRRDMARWGKPGR
jgi:phage head maturation protease